MLNVNFVFIFLCFCFKVQDHWRLIISCQHALLSDTAGYGCRYAGTNATKVSIWCLQIQIQIQIFI